MKNHPMTSGLPFSSKLRWGSYSLSIAKAACYKNWILGSSMKFLSSEFAYYFYKSTAQPCMGYYLHDQVGATSYSLNIWDELQTRECRTVNHSFETLPHCLNVATLSLFCRYCFGRCSSELAELFLLPYLCGRSTRYSNRLHNFTVTIFGCFNDVCQQFLPLHSQTVEFSACRMLSLDLLSKWF